MEVTFRTKKLERCYYDSRFAVREFGMHIARRYIQRIGYLEAVESLADLKQLRELDCHPLKGERKGEWAMRLDGFYRLIFTVSGDEYEIVRIEEVSKHYGD